MGTTPTHLPGSAKGFKDQEEKQELLPGFLGAAASYTHLDTLLRVLLGGSHAKGRAAGESQQILQLKPAEILLGPCQL